MSWGEMCCRTHPPAPCVPWGAPRLRLSPTSPNAREGLAAPWPAAPALCPLSSQTNTSRQVPPPTPCPGRLLRGQLAPRPPGNLGSRVPWQTRSHRCEMGVVAQEERQRLAPRPRPATAGLASPPGLPTPVGGTLRRAQLTRPPPPEPRVRLRRGRRHPRGRWGRQLVPAQRRAPAAWGQGDP